MLYSKWAHAMATARDCRARVCHGRLVACVVTCAPSVQAQGTVYAFGGYMMLELTATLTNDVHACVRAAAGVRRHSEVGFLVAACCSCAVCVCVCGCALCWLAAAARARVCSPPFMCRRFHALRVPWCRRFEVCVGLCVCASGGVGLGLGEAFCLCASPGM